MIQEKEPRTTQDALSSKVLGTLSAVFESLPADVRGTGKSVIEH